MKFTATVIIGLQLFSNASAFAPGAVQTRSVSSTTLNNSLRTLAITADQRKPKIPAIIQEVQTIAPTTSPKMGISSPAATTTPTEKEVRALFELWNSALATGDSRIVADRYIKKPMLLPTVSDKPRTDFESVKDYFDAFLLKEPQGKIVEGAIHIGEGWASVSIQCLASDYIILQCLHIDFPFSHVAISMDTSNIL